MTQRGAGAAIDDVDLGIGGHRAESVKGTRDIEIGRGLRRRLGPRGADGGDLDAVEAAPRGKMRPGAPGGADDADAKGRVRHVVMSAPTAVRRSPSGSSALRCDPSRVPVPSGTVRYVPTLRARADRKSTRLNSSHSCAS